VRLRHRRGRPFAALAVSAVAAVSALAACSPGDAPARPAAALTAASTAASTGASTGATGTFTNPVYAHDFPDPQAIRVGHTFYAYGTNGDLGNVPTLRSSDLVHWRPVGDAMPHLAPWTDPGRTWAPEVLRVSAHRFVLYYTAAGAAALRQCVGRAVARTPVGPFVDRSQHPLVCQAGQGGSIDAHPFRDADGTLYLYWKNDGNCCGQDTHLWAQRMTPDGLRLTGGRTALLAQGAPWEGSLIEAPFMWRHGSAYVLFYSANAFDSEAYAIGYASCKGPEGPCTKAPENPIVHSAPGAAGPGHMSLATDHGRTWMLYHAWPPDAVGSSDPGRVLWLDRVSWVGGRPQLHGPTDSPQRLP